MRYYKILSYNNRRGNVDQLFQFRAVKGVDNHRSIEFMVLLVIVFVKSSVVEEISTQTITIKIKYFCLLLFKRMMENIF